MNHKQRCNLLVETMLALGYTGYLPKDYSRGNANQPSNCDAGYLFYPNPKMRGNNFEMYRGYVHDTEDVVYLRINIPGIKYGLGQESFKLDTTHQDFAKHVAEFCQPVTLSKQAVKQLIHEFEMRQGSTKVREKVICNLCDGTKIDLHRQKLFPDMPETPCKACRGKMDRIKVTETYYLFESPE